MIFRKDQAKPVSEDNWKVSYGIWPENEKKSEIKVSQTPKLAKL